MKIVFLLALACLASCKSILPGGDQARNVELEYTYIDETGKPIRVKVQSDLINLAGIREVESKEPEPRFVQFAPKMKVPKPEVHTIYVQAPAPIPFGRKIEFKAPEPKVVYVQAPKPKTVEVEVDVPIQQLHRFIAPTPSTRTFTFEAPEPEVQHFSLPTHRTLQTKSPSIRYVSSEESSEDDDFGSSEE